MEENWTSRGTEQASLESIVCFIQSVVCGVFSSFLKAEINKMVSFFWTKSTSIKTFVHCLCFKPVHTHFCWHSGRYSVKLRGFWSEAGVWMCYDLFDGFAWRTNEFSGPILPAASLAMKASRELSERNTSEWESACQTGQHRTLGHSARRVPEVGGLHGPLFLLRFKSQFWEKYSPLVAFVAP